MTAAEEAIKEMRESATTRTSWFYELPRWADAISSELAAKDAEIERLRNQRDTLLMELGRPRPE